MRRISNYTMAIISIILITILTIFSLTLETKQSEISGKAYMISNLEKSKDIIRIDKSPGIIKLYEKTEPESYAYLRKKYQN